MSRQVLADSWYAGRLAAANDAQLHVEVLDDVLLRRPVLRAVVARSAVLRGVVLFTLGRRAAAVVTVNAAPGTRTLIALTALLGRRNLVLLEYIQHFPPSGGCRGKLRRIQFWVLRQVLLPRALMAAQVLTETERGRYSTRMGVHRERFCYIPWPRRSEIPSCTALPPRGGDNSRRVLASGHRTDWVTFFAAARDTSWEVTAVCSSADFKMVRTLVGNSQTRILTDIPAGQHQKEVVDAAVYVLALSETQASIGQIRIMNATDAGTPLVVSNVAGITGYVGADSAVLVTPGDASALRRAITLLLADPPRQELLRNNAFAASLQYTATDYHRAIRELVHKQATSARARTSLSRRSEPEQSTEEFKEH